MRVVTVDARAPRDLSERIAALDGFRALAVSVVLLYHAGFSGARGGFLGVDMFFVLSGYLITGLLAGEYLRSGRISLRHFYHRRARRLLPALFTMIAAVCVVVVTRLPQEAATFRRDASAAVGYIANWWFIARGQSYFGGTGRPSLLLHVWSLAVEEQFYVLWPLFLVAMLCRDATAMPVRGRIQTLWRAIGWATALAACSVGMMAMLYSPWRDPSRVYYGTDTRAFELFTGVVLALVQTARSAEEHPEPVRAATSFRIVSREAVAVGALVLLAWAVVFVPATSSRLYPAGLIGVCLASAALIRAVVSGGYIAAALAWRPVVWLGERSYAVYLWHWPIFDLTRPGVDVAWSVSVDFAARIAVTLILAETTFRFIERPIRDGALGRIAVRCRSALREQSFAFPASIATAALTLSATAVWLVGTLSVTARQHPTDTRAVAVDAGPATSLVAVTPPASGSNRVRVPTNTAMFPTTMPTPPAKPPRVALVGDSQGMTLYLNRPPDTARYLKLSDDTTEGCGFLGGRITSSSGDRRDLDAECGRSVAKWAQRAAGSDIAILMIGAWDVFDERVNGTPLKFGTPPWDAYFTSRLGQAVNALKNADVHRVELALLPCYRPIHTSGPGSWLERGDDTRTHHINTLLTTYTANPANQAEPLYPPPAFCSDPALASSRAYRWDGVHYYKPGASLYLRTVIPQLLK